MKRVERLLALQRSGRNDEGRLGRRSCVGGVPGEHWLRLCPQLLRPQVFLPGAPRTGAARLGKPRRHVLLLRGEPCHGIATAPAHCRCATTSSWTAVPPRCRRPRRCSHRTPLGVGMGPPPRRRHPSRHLPRVRDCELLLCRHREHAVILMTPWMKRPSFEHKRGHFTDQEHVEHQGGHRKLHCCPKAEFLCGWARE